MEAVVKRKMVKVRKTSSGSEGSCVLELMATLQDTQDNADWAWFNSDDMNVFMETVVRFIRKLADDAVHKTIITMFSIQKLWVDKTICDALRSHTAAYNIGLNTENMDKYKAASHNV